MQSTTPHSSAASLLEKPMTKGTRTVYPPVWVDLQALTHQLPQRLAFLQHLIACTHLMHILPVIQLPVRLFLADQPIPEQPPKPSPARLVYHPLRHPPRVLADHHQVLAIPVSGKQQVPGQQLHSYASDRPHIRQLVPLATLKNHLRGSVLPCANHRTVRLVEKSCPAEIYHPYFISTG